MDIVPPSAPSRAVRRYQRLLRLFPAPFRDDAESELVAWFGRAWAASAGSRRARARLLVQTALDLGTSLVIEWLTTSHPPARPARHGASSMETLWQDLRYGLRTLRAAPFVTLVAVLTVALGVGATTTMMSVADALLLRPPAGVSAPAGLVTVHAKSRSGGGFHSFSYHEFRALEAAPSGLGSLAAYGMLAASVRTGDEPELEAGMLVSGAYFSTLGARAELGRLFGAAEDRPGAPPVVVLSDGLWRRRFGADPAVIGRSVTVNGQPLTVIGVADRGFRGHFAGLDLTLWVPLAQSPLLTQRDDFTTLNTSWLELIGRLRPGIAPAAVIAALNPVAADEGRLAGLDEERSVDVRRYLPVPAEAVLPVGGFLGLLLLLAGFVLLIASANVGSVLLARASTRAREMAVRVALGAGRARLMRQLLIESLALFLIGGAAGTGLAVAATRALASVRLPMEVPLALDFHLDLLVLGATLLITLVVGILFGLMPARQVLRTDPAQVLREGGSSIRLLRGRLRGVLVTSQVAGTACLLVTAGLFARGLAEAGEIRPGFTPEGLSVTELDLGVRHYDESRAEAFVTALEQRVAAMPGVSGVTTGTVLPLSNMQQSTVIALPERAAEPNQGRFETDLTSVSPGYFATLKLPLVEGRPFAATDRLGAPAVAIINQTLARTLWPGEDPIGKRLNTGSLSHGIPTEVVGLAADAKYRSLGEAPVPMLYLPLPREFSRRVSLVIRTTRSAVPSVRAIRDAVHDLDPELPVGQQASYATIVGLALLPNRIALLLAVAFGATGLLLAALGLYGLLAFRVQSRRKEIGIRMALGASARQIRRLVVGEGVRLTAIGLGCGLVLAAGIGKVLGSMLFGVSPFDPLTYAGIAALLLGVGWCAAMGPTRRALGTDPVEVLRHD